MPLSLSLSYGYDKIHLSYRDWVARKAKEEINVVAMRIG